MKKVISAILALVLLLSLCACGGKNTTPDTSEPAATTQPTEAAVEITAAPTECVHTYTSSVTTEASCASEGVMTFVCDQCGDSYTEPVEKIEHTYEDATCTAPKTCTVCGATDGEALGHSFRNATCTAPKTCTTCGTTEGKALGHKFTGEGCTGEKTCTVCGKTEKNSHKYAAATCTAPKTCSVCGVTEGDALGHSYKEATCTAPKTCSKCGTTEGEALGHSWSAATCTTPKTCSTCGATEGKALGHSYAAATCTEPKTCTVCGATQGKALGHSWKAATCTEPKTCSKCGATSGSALGHNYQNGTCTGCGDVETITHPFETGEGYAITVSSNEVVCYQISTSELMYDLCTTEKPARGWYKFREHNGTTYYSPSPSWGWLSIRSYTISGRTVILDLYEETLEMELISDNQYKVTKGIESVPAGVVFTFGADMCSFAGHLYERSCENDVTCMYCGHFKCAGLGHEYGEDDICFRCYSVMRPSN